MQATATETTYFEQRMKQLGITANMHLITNQVYGSFKRGEEGFREASFQIFQPDPEGNICIYYPTLDGLKMQFRQSGEGASRITKDYFIKRLAKPKGDNKYLLRRGSGTKPFLPPAILDKYQKKEKIKNLFFTEGSIKAFVAAMNGIDIIGFTSISHLSDSLSGEMFQEVKEIIDVCGVERLIWLVDGDCNRLTNKPIDQTLDLRTRPNHFFGCGTRFKQYFDQFDNIEKWFIHPLSDDIPGNPKGIDDLLLSEGINRSDVLTDLQRFDKKSGYEFFYKINISYGSGELLRYFHLTSALDFYLFHLEQRNKLRKGMPELDSLDNKEFIYAGTRYRYDIEKKDLIIVTPADAKKYFRVGDQYHELIQIPNKFKETDLVFHRRMKQTIIDDHGPLFLKHVPKYKAFCVVPDHTNFQQVINHCYNLYHPFEHEPEEGDCENTINYLKHIFGSNDIKYKNFKSGDEECINELDLGLDYIQLLYQRPTQTLPILCLVSREQATGKSTFGFWLRALFTQNVAIVGNAELSSDFNAPLVGRLVIICDEAKIDKQVVVEKVKSLSTADKIFMNAKGKDQNEIEFFGKFIFQTNYEENFIYASEDDVRYWIRKIPVAKIPDVDLLMKLKEEIPAFINMLNRRQLKTSRIHRAWFDPNAIKTEALKKVIAYSMPTIEKEIRSHIRDMFLDFPDLNVIEMAKKDIKEEFFKNKNYEMDYLQRVLEERVRVSVACSYVFDNRTFSSVEELRAAFPKADPAECRKSPTRRYRFHRMEDKHVDGGRIERTRVEVQRIGRPFVFRVEDFLTEGERQMRYMQDPELKAVFGQASSVTEDDTLPF